MPILLVLIMTRSAAAARGTGSMSDHFLAFYRDSVLNRLYNDFPGAIDGSTWPPGAVAQTMSGVRRADNVVSLLAAAVEDGIPGHFIETGVWKGGLSFLAAKTLEVLGEHDRLTYLADSFGGIPRAPQDGNKYTRQDRIAHGPKFTILNNNSVSAVQNAARRFHLQDSQLRWVEGFFNDSIPKLVAAEPNISFAVVRLDGDTYFSTMDAIKHLYPRLQPGGFLIIDDYTEWQGCAKAVLDFRRMHSISEPLTLIPHKYREHTIGAYWRKGSTSPPQTSESRWPTCVPAEGAHARSGKRVVRASNSYLPQTLRELAVEDTHHTSKNRSVVLPFNADMKNGNALIETVYRGDKLHFCTG